MASAAVRLATSCLTAVAIGCNQTHNSSRPVGEQGPDADVDASIIDFAGFNNNTLLSGASFPGGPDDIERMHRIVLVDQSPDNERFETTTAVIARASASATTNVAAIIPVKNVSDRPYCFVTVVHVTYFGLGDAVLGEASLRELRGSVGRNASTFTATCLAPEETGYFCDQVVGDVYESISRVTVTLDARQDTELHDPEAQLSAAFYTYDVSTGLTVSFTNDGKRAARIADGESLYLLLSTNGEPVWFRTLATLSSPAAFVLPASGTSTLVDASVAYGSSVDRILVLFSWADL